MRTTVIIEKKIYNHVMFTLSMPDIKAVFFVGIGTNDDIGYTHHAYQLSKGNNIIANGGSQLGFRLGMNAPLAVLFKCFGCNEISASIFPLFSSLITCAFIFLTAHILWGVRAAVFASLLWISYPLQIVFDTQLSPSNQQAACMITSIFLLFKAKQNEKRCEYNKFTPVLYVLSGAILCFGWLVNEVFVVIAVAAIPVLLVSKIPLKGIILALSGFVLIVFLELIIAYHFSGDLFARIHAIIQTENIIGSNKSLEYLPRVLFKIKEVNFSNEEGHFGILWYLFIVLTICMFFQKQWLICGFACGVWLVVFYFQWGVMSLDGTPITKYIRYLSMIVPLQCLAIGGILTRWLQQFQPQKKICIYMCFTLLCIHLYVCGALSVNAARIKTNDFHDISHYLISQKEDVIAFMDEMTAQYVEIISGNSFDIQWVDHYKNKPAPQKGYLVINGSRRVVEDHNYRKQLPGWFQNPPQRWEVVKEIKSKNKCEGFYRSFDPVIYKIQ
ncbi:MAG: hypothetical protein OMM_00791 [Candidatus Magnetoglobus multicellularis str. Araruama]|uniref:Glycosyltransferase RgtA/B/C/D-like domain-containing protein n=1 Tax=Candidatus Magnetoglobus multicellularis str. Araruama TaxID=890399 RepID=A0A1V1PFU4_9BACT|nr:MAG: hypothetical protein OMM_00791 [Candidatus Magnetoglobus multicellularis str. Araruama]